MDDTLSKILKIPDQGQGIQNVDIAINKATSNKSKTICIRAGSIPAPCETIKSLRTLTLTNNREIMIFRLEIKLKDLKIRRRAK
jgi:hypothetical protein